MPSEIVGTIKISKDIFQVLRMLNLWDELFPGIVSYVLRSPGGFIGDPVKYKEQSNTFLSGDMSSNYS